MPHLKSFVAACVLGATASAEILGNSLNDCKAFAAMFDNTCDSLTSALSSVSSHQGETMTCTGTMPCPDTTSGRQNYTSRSPCTYQRKLCVTCEKRSGDVFIRVQGNSLPNHCSDATVNTPTTINVDWEVAFNPDVSGQLNYQDSDVNSVEKTTEILCDIQRTSSDNMLSASEYTQTLYESTARRMLAHGDGPPPEGGPPSGGGSGEGPPSGGSSGGPPSGGGSGGSRDQMGTQSGVAFSGGYIYNSLSGENLDAVEFEASTLDVCLSHASPFGGYHYHYWTPCVKKGFGPSSETQAPELCKDASGCMTDTPNFIQGVTSDGQASPFASTQNHGGYIGLARDGHLIVGPYNERGQSWGCDEHDICNGTFVDGQYVYVSTGTFPYVVGCWGPAPKQAYEATCSSYSCLHSGQYTPASTGGGGGGGGSGGGGMGGGQMGGGGGSGGEGRGPPSGGSGGGGMGQQDSGAITLTYAAISMAAAAILF